jgi:hypothetical protein
MQQVRHSNSPEHWLTKLSTPGHFETIAVAGYCSASVTGHLRSATFGAANMRVAMAGFVPVIRFLFLKKDFDFRKKKGGDHGQ